MSPTSLQVPRCAGHSALCPCWAHAKLTQQPLHTPRCLMTISVCASANTCCNTVTYKKNIYVVTQKIYCPMYLVLSTVPGSILPKPLELSAVSDGISGLCPQLLKTLHGHEAEMGGLLFLGTSSVTREFMLTKATSRSYDCLWVRGSPFHGTHTCCHLSLLPGFRCYLLCFAIRGCSVTAGTLSDLIHVPA